MPSTPLCELCDVGAARISCSACSMSSLCELCDSELHKSAKTAQHQRKYIQSGEDVPGNDNTTQSPASSPSAAGLLSPTTSVTSSPFGSPSQPARGSFAIKPRASINLLTRPIIPPHRASIAHPLGAVSNGRSLIPLPPPTEDSELDCDLCNDEAAEVHCEACNMNFCLKGECDEKMHQPQKMKDHVRTPIALHKRSASEEKSPTSPTSDDSAADAPFVKMCDTCSEKMANWYCNTCQRFFCEPCDHSIHKSSAMKTHSRAPYPPVFGRPNSNTTESEGAIANENRQIPNLHVQVESASPTILSPQAHQRPSFSPLSSPLGISPSLAALATQSRSLGLGGAGGLGRSSRAMSVMAPAGNGRTPAFQLPIRPNQSSTPTANAFTVKPAASSISATNAAPICDICEDGRASVRCDECDMNLCISNQCDEQLHAPMKMKHHVRNPINAISFTNSIPRPAAAVAVTAAPVTAALMSSPSSPSIAAPIAASTPTHGRPSTAPVNNNNNTSDLSSPGPGGASLTSPASAFSFDSPSSQPGRPASATTLSPQPFRARASSVMIKTPPPAKSSIKQHNADGSILSLVPAITPSSASNQPSPAGTARTARGSRLCELCENCPAQVYCAACPMYLCTSGGCDKQLHAPAKMAHHIRSAIPKPTCSLCEENVAQLWCFDCKKHYCTTDDCDREYHKPAKSQNHRREHVDELHRIPQAEQKQNNLQSEIGATPAFNIVVTPSAADSPTVPQSEAAVDVAASVVVPVVSPTTTSATTASSVPSPLSPPSLSQPVSSNASQPPPPVHARSPPAMANVVMAHVIATAAKLPPVHPPALPASNTASKAVSFFVLCDHCDKELATVVCETCQFTTNLTHQQRRFYCAKCETAVHKQDKASHKRRPITKADTLNESPTATASSSSALSFPQNPLLSSKPLLTPIVSPAVSPAPSARSTLMSPNLPTSTHSVVVTQRSLEVTVLPMCDRCSNTKADIYCEDCEFNLDHACFEQLHKSTSAKAHPRKMLVLQPSTQGSTPKSVPPVPSVPATPIREVSSFSDPQVEEDSAAPKFRSPVPRLDLSKPSLAIDGPLHPSALLPLSAFGTAHSSPTSDSDIDIVSSPPTARDTTINKEAAKHDTQATILFDASQSTSVTSVVESVPHSVAPVASSTEASAHAHPVASNPILAPLATLETNLLQRVSSLEHQLQESVQLKSARIHSSRQEAKETARSSEQKENSSTSQPHGVTLPSPVDSNASRQNVDLSSTSTVPRHTDSVASRLPAPLPPASSRGVSDTPAAMAAIRAELKEARAQLQQFQQLAEALGQQLQQQQKAVASLSTKTGVATAAPAIVSAASPSQATESSLSSISIPFQQELTQLISNAIQTSLSASKESSTGTERRTKQRSKSKPKPTLAADNSFLQHSNMSSRTPLRKALQPLFHASPSSDGNHPVGGESSPESDAAVFINDSSSDVSHPSSRNMSLQSSQRETSPRGRKFPKKKKKAVPVVPRLPLPTSSLLPLSLTQSTKTSQRKRSQSPKELAVPVVAPHDADPSPMISAASARPVSNDSVVFLSPTQRSFAPSAAATRRSPILIPSELDSHRMSDEEEEEKQSVHLLTSTEEEEHNETQRASVVSKATDALIARYREEAAASIVQAQAKRQLIHQPALTPLQVSASSSPSLTPSLHRPLVVDPLSLSASASASKRRARELRRQAEIEEQLKFETQRRQADQQKIAKLQQQIHDIQSQLQEKTAISPVKHSMGRQHRHHASTPSLLSQASLSSFPNDDDHVSTAHRPHHVVRASVSATLAQTTPRTMFKLMEAQIYADHVKQAEEKNRVAELQSQHSSDMRQSTSTPAEKQNIPSLLSESIASQQMQHAMSAFDRLSPEQQRQYFADNIVFSSSYLHPQLPWELQLARPNDEDQVIQDEDWSPTRVRRHNQAEKRRSRASRSSFDEDYLTQIYSPELLSKSRHGGHASPLKPIVHHERTHSSANRMNRVQSAGSLHPQYVQKLPSSNSWMS